MFAAGSTELEARAAGLHGDHGLPAEPLTSTGLGVLGHDRPTRRFGLTPKDSSGSEAPRGA